MLFLLLAACAPDPLSTPELEFATDVPVDSDSVDEPAPPETLATCLAAGEELVELGTVQLTTAALSDLEVAPNGAVLALGVDGSFHRVQPTALNDAPVTQVLGTHAEMLDVVGDRLLLDVSGVHVGTVEGAELTPVEWAWGDSAISPDGTTVAFSAMSCGVDSGVIDVATGTRSALGADVWAVEYLDDGRLVGLGDGEGWNAKLTLLEDFVVQAEWEYAGAPNPGDTLEVEGTIVLTATSGDHAQGTLERVDVATGESRTVLLPFTRTVAVAHGEALDWALGIDGLVVGTDGTTLHTVGTWPDTQDLVADPAGTWLALAGGDGALRVFGCE